MDCLVVNRLRDYVEPTVMSVLVSELAGEGGAVWSGSQQSFSPIELSSQCQ